MCRVELALAPNCVMSLAEIELQGELRLAEAHPPADLRYVYIRDLDLRDFDRNVFAS